MLRALDPAPGRRDPGDFGNNSVILALIRGGDGRGADEDPRKDCRATRDTKGLQGTKAPRDAKGLP
jgi:hypothetical protein